MNKVYNVLWFDDEHDTLEAIAEKAIGNDVELLGVKNAEEGLEILKTRRNEFDAVLVDGKFYENALDQSNKVISDQAFGKVAFHLQSESDKGNYMPWFILSGKPSFSKEKHPMVTLLGKSAFGDGKVFDKNLDEEDELFTQMKKAINESDQFKVKQKYKKILDLIDDSYLGKSEEERLNIIVSNLEKIEDDYSTKDLFTPIRKIIERIMDRLREIGSIPGDLTNLNAASRFIAATEHGYTYHSIVLNPTLIFLFKSLLEVSNDATHINSKLQLKVDEHLLESNTSYLYKASVFQLFEILEWFKNFIDNNQSVEANQSRWEKNEEEEMIIAELQQDESNNYFFEDYVFNYNHVHGIYELGDSIGIKKVISNTSYRTKDLYPHFVVEFEKIEE